MNTSNRLSGDRGFTLIELLIVITILGILAGVALVAVGTTRKDSTHSACKTDFRSIDLSAESVFTKTGSYPATSGGGDDTQANVNTKYAALINLNNAATNGALLHNNYPFSTDYRLIYAISGSGYTITVKKGDGSTPTFGSGQSATDASGCDAV